MQALIIGIIAGIIGILGIYFIYKFFNNIINNKISTENTLPSLSDLGMGGIGETVRGGKKYRRKLKK